MPRANRYIQPGCVYHLTHRCHNRQFLLRFARDRTDYRRRLRASLDRFDVALLNYCITSNHTHLLVLAGDPEAVSHLMQKLEGEFAEAYNLRKHRSGAFWDGRYGCTMVDSGLYVWNCLRYIDLNMVRAGVVRHPSEWPWCGYAELQGLRQRYRLLDIEQLLALCGGGNVASFRASYQAAVQTAIDRRELAREPWWTESIAVGRETFVREIAALTRNRRELDICAAPAGHWTVRETVEAYG